MVFFSVKVTLVDLGIIENYVLSNSFLYYLKKKRKTFFIIVYISCECFIFLKTDLIKTNKNYIILF